MKKTPLVVRALIPLALFGLTLALAAHAQPMPFSQKPFTDVSKGAWYYDSVEYLRVNNVLKGYLDGKFRPNNRMTRAEFVSLVINPYLFSMERDSDCLSAHFGTGSTMVFYQDVSRNHWAAQDICVATVNGIVNGYPDGSFHPDAHINFAEAAKVAARILAITVRKDKLSDDRWYTVYVQRLAELHAIPPTVGSVRQLITRAEMAEIIYRLKTANTTKTSVQYQKLSQ